MRWEVHEFYYEYMLPLFHEKCKIIYTDSLIYYIECDVYTVMKRDINRFNTSDYMINNAYDISLVNKKVLDLMKNENNERCDYDRIRRT